jgi:hypothetical protein
MSIQTQFEKFLHDIEPSETTKANASAAHTTLRRFLREHATFKHVHVDTFLSGSYKRNTAIRPRLIDGKDTRPDIDIIVVTNHVLTHKPQGVLSLLHRTLDEGYAIEEPLNTRSVGVSTASVKMDVVPIIAPGGMDGTLYIPDRNLGQWLATNPPQHTAWTTEVNQASGGRFKPLVKLMKWWRRENPTGSKRPKGFVIECIIAECMDRNETRYAELFIGTLEMILSRYALSMAQGRVPEIDDPGVSGNSVTTSVSFAEFKAFYAQVSVHAQLGRSALTEQTRDSNKALALWRRIFGPRFPEPTDAGVATLLRSGIAPGALSFPNHPITPRKPGGFA